MLSIIPVLFLTAVLHQWCALAISDISPMRQTASGQIRGLRRQVLNKEVDVFLGIPFAEPPLGERRFRRPEKIQSWTEIFNATKLPRACNQIKDTAFNQFPGVDMWNANTEISEDCLYLNVWQPVGGAPHKAVLIWVYGGGFYGGTSALSLYDGSILAVEEDVVVMSMQYRLGPFGFLYLKGGAGDKAPAAGNMGLIDQALAIQWLHENAAVFNGDPKRITLFGESAGAGSVSLHLLSPVTKDIIQSAIMQSGSAVTPWACDMTDMAHTGGLELATLLGCTSGNFSRSITEQERMSIIECLLKANADSITEKQWYLTTEKAVIYTAFAPTVDGYFLTEQPSVAALKDAKERKSILLGVNQDEGMAFLFYLLQDLYPLSPKVPNISREEFIQAVKTLFHFESDIVTDIIAFEYGEPFDSASDELNYRKIIDDVVGDLSFKCPVIEFAKIYADAGKNVYMYQYNHRTSANPWPEWSGVMHGFEIDHVFGQPLNSTLNYRPDEVELSKKVVKYWANFAKTGDPNKGDEHGAENVDVVWPVYRNDTRNTIALNTGSLNIQPLTITRRCEFWKKIYPRIKFDSARGNSNSTFRPTLFHDVQLTAILCLTIAILCRYGLL